MVLGTQACETNSRIYLLLSYVFWNIIHFTLPFNVPLSYLEHLWIV